MIHLDLDVEFQIKNIFIIILLNKQKDFQMKPTLIQVFNIYTRNVMDVKYVGAFVRLAWVLVKAAI